ncbi:hypothetical protein M8J77_013999 [Diaphorina citri]|nr:hypothetical protein M8J77_013999 [Diaphorina citri]
MAFRAYAPDVPSRTRARVWHLGPMPQTVSNLPLQPSQSSGALWLKAMCDALWLTAMCDALWLTAMCDALWLTAMCDALWLTAMCDTLWLTTKGLISLHISSLATGPIIPHTVDHEPRFRSIKHDLLGKFECEEDLLWSVSTYPDTQLLSS